MSHAGEVAMVSGSIVKESGGQGESVGTSGRQKPVVLFVLLAMVCVLAAYWWVSGRYLRLQIAFAEEQTAIFDEMRVEAQAGSASTAVECLEYTVTYYPSGTKQDSGSNLDKIVERARQNAIREIIADLRTKTSRDFGSDPQRWIEAY